MHDSIGFVTNMVENRVNNFYESINTIGISGNAASTLGTLSCTDCGGSLIFELPIDTSTDDSGPSPSDKSDKSRRLLTTISAHTVYADITESLAPTKNGIVPESYYGNEWIKVLPSVTD